MKLVQYGEDNQVSTMSEGDKDRRWLLAACGASAAFWAVAGCALAQEPHVANALQETKQAVVNFVAPSPVPQCTYR